MHLRLKMMFASYGAFSCGWALCGTAALAQTALPQVDVTVASPIARRAPARPAPVQPAPAQPTPAQPTATPGPAPETLQGTIPIITDQFATITVVPNEELRRNGASTLGDLLFEKPGITGSSFAPGASSRPIIRGLDVNRVRIQEDGVGANGAPILAKTTLCRSTPLRATKWR
jgi:iron complex outermembrane receptor protein